MNFEQWKTAHDRIADREHAYAWYGRQQGKTAALIFTLRANRSAKVLVLTVAQREYLLARDVLPGQIVLIKTPNFEVPS